MPMPREHGEFRKVTKPELATVFNQTGEDAAPKWQVLWRQKKSGSSHFPGANVIDELDGS